MQACSESTHPIFLVSLQGAVEEIHGDVFILIQPLNNKRLEPPAERQIHTVSQSSCRIYSFHTDLH